MFWHRSLLPAVAGIYRRPVPLVTGSEALWSNGMSQRLFFSDDRLSLSRLLRSLSRHSHSSEWDLRVVLDLVDGRPCSLRSSNESFGLSLTFLVGRPCPLRYSNLKLSLTLSTVFLALVMRSSFLLPTIPWSFYFDCYGTSNCHCSHRFLVVCVFFPNIIVALFFLVTNKHSSLLVPCLAATLSLLVLSFSAVLAASLRCCRDSPRFQLALVSLPPSQALPRLLGSG